jgi:hypothetical protein
LALRTCSGKAGVLVAANAGRIDRHEIAAAAVNFKQNVKLSLLHMGLAGAAADALGIGRLRAVAGESYFFQPASSVICRAGDEIDTFL